MNIYQIAIDLDDKNRARLESKRYDRDYVDVPNSALPPFYKDGLNKILSACFENGELDEGDSILTIKANEGFFKRLYVPYVFHNGEKNSLSMQFGNKTFELLVQEGELKVPNPDENAKIKLEFEEAPINGYESLTLKLSVRKNGELYYTNIPVRTADWDNPPNPAQLTLLLEEEDYDGFFDLIGAAPEKGSGKKYLDGPLVKAGMLPLGEYKVTDYQRNDSGKFPSIQLQTNTQESFSAEVPIKKEDGEFGTEEREVAGSFRVKCNSKLKKFMEAEPKLPFTFTVTEHGSYNGYPTAKVDINPESGFEVDDEALSLSF